MGLELVPTGRDVPKDVNVVIEIPMNSEPVKYEVDKESGAIFVDRVLTTPMRYPCNYGYIPHTLSGDGDPADVLVVMPVPLIPGSVIRVRTADGLVLRIYFQRTFGKARASARWWLQSIEAAGGDA